jgi:hypothetical protein
VTFGAWLESLLSQEGTDWGRIAISSLASASIMGCSLLMAAGRVGCTTGAHERVFAVSCSPACCFRLGMVLAPTRKREASSYRRKNIPRERGRRGLEAGERKRCNRRRHCSGSPNFGRPVVACWSERLFRCQAMQLTRNERPHRS